MIFRVLALLLLLSSCSFQNIWTRSPTVFATTLKFLLIFLFTIDIIAPSISTFYLISINVLFSLAPLSSPEPKFIEDNIQTNDYLLKTLNKMSEEDQLNKD